MTWIKMPSLQVRPIKRKNMLYSQQLDPVSQHGIWDSSAKSISAQTGLSLIEVLVSLLILSFALLCMFGDDLVRQKHYRLYIERNEAFRHLIHEHECLN